jgi:RNA polymerase sigma-70 factor (ECF subfamily)
MSPDTEADRLVLALRAGQRQALGELYRSVEPLIGMVVRQIASQGLPSALDVDDLEQESWLLLAELAARWQPELGTFSSYVVGAMPWALGRYVRRHSPTYRAASVQVLAVDDRELERLIEERSEETVHDVESELACAELLAPLPPMERSVVLMRVVERQPIEAIASALRLTATSVRRAYERGIARLRSARPIPPNEPLDDLARLVLVLHRGASADGRLPGRAWACGEACVSQGRYGQLMHYLVAAGCIRGRSQRKTGWLVDRDPDATLERVAGWRRGWLERASGE